MSEIPKDIIVTEDHYNNLVHERDAFKVEVERLRGELLTCESVIEILIALPEGKLIWDAAIKKRRR